MDTTQIVDGRTAIMAEVDRMRARGAISAAEARISDMPEAKFGDSACPLKHSFGDGIYVRDMFAKKGMLVVTKIHKTSHPFFLMAGEVSILTEEGIIRVKAPYYSITKPGTKRVLYIHDDCTWVTCHATQKTDLEEIENDIIAKSFDEIPQKDLYRFVEVASFNVDEFRALTKKVIDAEKEGFWSDWTHDQQELYTAGKWEEFSLSRGYSTDEISDFKKWLAMKADAEGRNLRPLDMIKDIATQAALKNILKDSRGEILMSSHIPGGII